MTISLGATFERFVEQSPLTVMARTLMEHALGAQEVDALFARTAQRQYTEELLFSSCVDLMSMVVLNIQPSIHAAYQEVAERLPVSVQSVYNKLNGLELEVSRALVRHSAERFESVIRAMGGQLPELFPGYRIKILDGNHLAATERKLKVLKGSHAGPLPGQSLVVLDSSLRLATDVFPCEDGHAQERSLLEDVLSTIKRNEIWVADRNFCTSRFLLGIAAAQGFFAIREHASNAPCTPVGKRKRRGRIETGKVYEQDVLVLQEGQEPLKARRITIELDTPTRDGDAEIHILSNLPKRVAKAKAIAELYRTRWSLETLFQELTVTLTCELNTLGYPKAALFGFCVALMAYNVVSTAKAALRAEHGHEKVQNEVSDFYMVNEVTRAHDGMMIAVPAPKWKVFRKASADEIGQELRRCAKHARLRAYKKHPRAFKKPVPKRTRFRNKPHVSTARLLVQAQENAP